MDEGSTYHPIACESCRNKKSKCDRDLPVCSQCAASGAECRYPPTNKRGLPSGYVALAEQRLLESEVVIFELLSTLYNLDDSPGQKKLSQQELRSLSGFAKAQSKSKKVEEWKKFPLSTDEQRRAWWLRKRELIAVSRENQPFPNDSPVQFEIMQEASPLTNGPTLEEDLNVSFSRVRQVQHSGQQVQAWESEVHGSSNYDMDVPLEDSNAHASNTFLASGGLQDAVMAGSKECSPPSAPAPNVDRWRKYF